MRPWGLGWRKAGVESDPPCDKCVRSGSCVQILSLLVASNRTVPLVMKDAGQARRSFKRRAEGAWGCQGPIAAPVNALEDNDMLAQQA